MNQTPSKSILAQIIPGVLCALFLLSPLVSAQQVKIDAFPIQSSTLLDDLKILRKNSPKLSAEEFVAEANRRLDRQGFNFTFSFDASLCQKLEQTKNARKDKNAPLNVRGNLKTVEGEPASILLPTVRFDQAGAKTCGFQMPLLEITGQTFITIIQNTNIKFYLPDNFLVNEAVLLDNKNPAAILKRWKLPFRTVPLSVSDDGTILYTNLPDSELENLALMIFDAGVLQFCLKKDIDPAKKAAILKNSAANNANSEFTLINFTKGNLIQTLRIASNEVYKNQ